MADALLPAVRSRAFYEARPADGLPAAAPMLTRLGLLRAHADQGASLAFPISEQWAGAEAGTFACNTNVSQLYC